MFFNFGYQGLVCFYTPHSVEHRLLSPSFSLRNGPEFIRDSLFTFYHLQYDVE